MKNNKGRREVCSQENKKIKKIFKKKKSNKSKRMKAGRMVFRKNLKLYSGDKEIVWVLGFAVFRRANTTLQPTLSYTSLSLACILTSCTL